MDQKINKRITYYRKKNKLPQAEVAKMLGMKTNAYSRAEREGNIPCDMAIKLAEIFDIDVKSLLYENPVEDEMRLLKKFQNKSDYSDEILPNTLMLARNGYETQLLTMFKRCNSEKQKVIMQCVYSIYKSELKTYP